MVVQFTMLQPIHRDYNKGYAPVATDVPDVVEQLYLKRPNCTEVIYEPMLDMTIDFGGMAKVDELYVNIEVGGFRFSVREFHLDVLVERLQSKRDPDSGLIWFTNWRYNVAMTPKVAGVLHNRAQEQRGQRLSAIRETGRQIAEAADAAGIVHRTKKDPRDGGFHHL